jgi:transcriptional regulator
LYIPASFSEMDQQVLSSLIVKYPLGTLFSAGVSGLMVTPIPFLLTPDDDGKPKLIGHLARANPHWKDLVGLSECLVVFQGSDNYITPSWYPTKQLTHKVVPTWNYEIVEVKGIPTVIESTDWLRDQVEKITDSMESKRKQPWKITDAPPEYIAAMLKAIVGLQIEITSIAGKWKMSQNQSDENVQGVIDGLSQGDDPHSNFKVADAIRARFTEKKKGGV